MTNSSDEPTASKTPEELQADIADKREEMAATVTELQSRLDVKKQARAKVGDVKAQLTNGATTDAGKPRPELIGGAAVLVLAVVALVVWRARR